MKKSFKTPLLAVSLVLCLGLPVFADTIRLKDGSIIRGQVVGFKDQQFTVLVGTGTRGRRSRISLYMEDVESIEFDSFQASANAGADAPDGDMNVPSTQTARTEPSQTTTRPSTGPGRTPPTQTTTATTTRPPASSSPTFFRINTRVRGDNTTNGWTNSGLVVRRGQQLRISATGRVLIGGGRVSTPAGLAGIPDNEKLMRTEPTGALIAVIGDDNDNFILIGRSREFTAERDGVLFLGVNEGNLSDNTGAYDAVIEAEAISSNSSQR
ncbi:MAG TPA: hypothetical protein VE842_10745 [Pyrinomonadaceae bacterium]|jgi:hypothetical protein|nr:hypothetical protein [Pyrinomonadaceae bacterium]